MKLTFITPKEAIAHPRFLREFACGAVKKAALSITGLGLYRAMINGKRVGRDYLTPGFNDYDAYLRVQTYDVTDLLEGSNRMEVFMGEGWYMGRLGFDGGKCNRWGDQYLLAARLTIELMDGSTQVMETDDSWLAAPSAITGGNIYDGETRDDTRDDTRAVDETVPCAVADADYRLVDQFSPPIRVKAELKPRLIVTPRGEQVLDFGQNMAGVIRFTNRLPRGKTLRIQTGEVLQNGCFYNDNLRTAKSEFIYTSDGEVKEIEPMFTFFGFRYAKVEGFDEVNPEDFTALAISSDLRETLEAETSHEGINQLMKNTLWGQRSNFLDVPTDCPQRDERLGWTADTQVFVNTACYQMDCKDFYRKFMWDMRADQTMYYGGDIPHYSPSLKREAGSGSAVWADAATIVPWHVYMNYGDKALLEESYPMMRDYAETLIAADLKLGGTHVAFDQFTFGDWLAQDGMTPQSLKGGTDDQFIQGVYYMHSVELTAKAAAELGKADDASRYAELAQEIREALLHEYVSPAGNLTVDTQTGYVLALHYGVCRNPEKLIAGFKRRLGRDMGRITCGFTGAPLMIGTLLDNGLTDEAYRMLLSESFPGWLYSVKLGATTIWERWNSLEEDGSISGTGMNSLNHYAYGSVCEAIYSRIMGLENAAPGWKKAKIHPHIDGRLRHASIRYDSPAGEWRVSWKIEDDGSAALMLHVPEGASAEVILPDHPEHFHQEVGAGDYAYRWLPEKDYLHPFSIQTPAMDLMANENAAAVIRSQLPALYGLIADPRSEFAVTPLIGVAFAMPFLNPEEVMAIDPLLREVSL